MTRGIKKIVEDAKRAGYIVKFHNEETVTILKSKRGVGICIWSDGTATRADYGFDLTIATAIRTQKEMRKCLGL